MEVLFCHSSNIAQPHQPSLPRLRPVHEALRCVVMPQKYQEHFLSAEDLTTQR